MRTLPGRALALLILTNVLLLITIVTVILRLVGRYFILRAPAIDDLFAFLSLILTTGTIITIDLGIGFGTGDHEDDVEVHHAVLGRIRLATQILYIASSGLIKFTILLLYRQLFPGLRIYIIATMVLVVAITITFIFTALFQCHPIGMFWVTTEEGRLNCVATLVLWCDVSVTFLLTNIWITLLPLPTLCRLHLPWSKKFVVIAFLCSSGIVTCIAASVRLAYVIVLYKGHDPTYDSVPIYVCSATEITVALVACSIPPLRSAYAPSIEKFHSWRKRSKLASESESSTV